MAAATADGCVSCGLQLEPAAQGAFAKVGGALTTAVKAVLLADEVNRGSEGRKQQRQQTLAPLIGAACAGALAVTGKPCCCLHCPCQTNGKHLSSHRDMRS